MTEVTQVLASIEQGDPRAPELLLPLVYRELRRLAARKLARDAARRTLEPTALVHEAYLRLVDQDQANEWNSRGHFFAAAAEAMRRILVERARRKQSAKYGGRLVRRPLENLEVAADSPSGDVLALDEAITKLAAEAPAKAELVKLRYFAGLSHQEAAQVLGISRATADRYWSYAKAWLYIELSDSAGETPGSKKNRPGSIIPLFG
jgi:RNA polymerase sigma factor (TIGR02999 family)